MNKTKLTNEHYKRLILIKYLFQKGVDSLNEVEPFAAFGLLQIHDAIEMSLTMACELNDISTKKIEFEKYFGQLAQKGFQIRGFDVYQKLNKARVLLKHSGISASRADLDYFKAVLNVSIVDLYRDLFCVDFRNISTADLIVDLEIRENVLKSIKALNDTDIQSSLEYLAIAVNLFKRMASDRLYGIGLEKKMSSSINITVERNEKNLYEIIKHEKMIEKEIEGIKDVISWIGIGLDIKHLRRLKSTLPICNQTMDGNWHFYWTRKDFTEHDIESAKWITSMLVDLSIKHNS